MKNGGEVAWKEEQNQTAVQQWGRSGGEGEPRPLHTIIFVMYDGGGYNDKGCLDREYYILCLACCGLTVEPGYVGTRPPLQGNSSTP